MKEEPKGSRSPTSGKLKPRSKASKEARKKLYRKRTMDEVRKSLENGVDLNDRLDGNGVNTDESTVDLATNTAYSSGEYIAEYARSYSSKLKSERGEELPKKSEALRSEKIRVEGSKAEATAKDGSKKLQKEKIKKDYAKAVRKTEKKAKSAGKSAGKVGKQMADDTVSAVEVALRKIGELVQEHPLGCLVVALIIITVLVIAGSLSACGMAFGGVTSGSVSATYSAEDSDIYGAEADYCAKEAGLQTSINNIEYTYPGYDEYNYYLDSIGHNPWELTSILTVLYADYSRSAVQGTLTSLFDAQYNLSVTSRTETRYRTEERTGYYAVPVYDAENELMGYELFEYTYEVQVPYNYYILNVSLDNKGLGEVISNLGLDADTYELYQYLLDTKGERDYLW